MPFVQSKLLQQENVCSHTFTMQFCFTQDTFTYFSLHRSIKWTDRTMMGWKQKWKYILHSSHFSLFFCFFFCPLLIVSSSWWVIFHALLSSCSWGSARHFWSCVFFLVSCNKMKYIYSCSNQNAWSIEWMSVSIPSWPIQYL